MPLTLSASDLEVHLILGGAAIDRCDHEFVSHAGFTVCGKGHQCVHDRGRAALQGRVSRLELLGASAPVVVFSRRIAFPEAPLAAAVVLPVRSNFVPHSICTEAVLVFQNVSAYHPLCDWGHIAFVLCRYKFLAYPVSHIESREQGSSS